MFQQIHDYNTIGKVIQLHLTDKSLSTGEIGLRCGVSQSYVSTIIRNHKQSIAALTEITKDIPDYDIEETKAIAA